MKSGQKNLLQGWSLIDGVMRYYAASQQEYEKALRSLSPLADYCTAEAVPSVEIVRDGDVQSMSTADIMRIREILAGEVP